ncbi:hypothetical protein CLD20_08125 [Afifella sp. IM 167]|nr:hypothetical protein [Afifella sp. IM 167]
MRLARPGLQIPMPDRGGRLFSADGETVDMEDGFWAGLAREGDIETAPAFEAEAPDLAGEIMETQTPPALTDRGTNQAAGATGAKARKPRARRKES